MRAVAKIAQRFEVVLADVHRARFHLIWDGVTGLLRGNQATVTSLGRHLDRDIHEKHAIKCADRLLSNQHVLEERHNWYRAIASKVIGKNRRPTIIIDGTELDAGWGALRASVAMNGRPLTILDEVYPKNSFAKASVHRHFLRSLQGVLPTACRPILVVDGGFMGPFFQKVRALGWDYVGRLSSPMWVYPQDGTALQVRDLFAIARQKPRDLGPCEFTRSRYETRVVLYDGRSKRARKPTKRPLRGQNRERKRRLKAREPWVLATSCSDLSACDIVDLYRRRMQIEEGFRDDKSVRFGRGFGLARCKSNARLAVMLLLLALGNFCLFALGVIAEMRGIAQNFQANTVTNRRVLSLVFLGWRMLDRTRAAPSQREFQAAFAHLSRICAAVLT